MKRLMKIMGNFFVKFITINLFVDIKQSVRWSKGINKANVIEEQFLLPRICTEWKIKIYNRPFFAVVAIFSAACGFPTKKEKNFIYYFFQIIALLVIDATVIHTKTQHLIELWPHQKPNSKNPTQKEI